MNSSDITPTAWALALAGVQVFEPCLPTESEREEAFRKVLALVTSSLTLYEERASRRERRLHGPHGPAGRN